MARGVQINVLNGGLGRTVSAPDAIFGLILRGTFPQLDSTPTQITNLDTLIDLISYSVGGSNSSEQDNAYNQVAAFYSFPKNYGRKLWVMSVPVTVLQSAIVDYNQNYAKKLIEAAKGEISLLFISAYYANSYAPVILNGLDTDVDTAMTKASILAATFAGRNMPLRVVLDGIKMSNIAALSNFATTGTRNNVAINIASMDGKVAAQGLLAGRLASIAVNENAGAVEFGDLGITESQAKLTSGQSLSSINDNTLLESAADKGYITFWEVFSRYGYYFCDIPTVVRDSDDYKYLNDGRVVDKVQRLVYQVLIDYYLKQVKVNQDGTLDIMTVKTMEGKVENSLNINMVAKGEMSYAECIIDPAQNVLSTGQLLVGVRDTPTGTLRTIIVNVSSYNPAL